MSRSDHPAGGYTSYGLTTDQIREVLIDMFLADKETATYRIGPIEELCSQLPTSVYNQLCAEAITEADLTRRDADYIRGDGGLDFD